MGCVQQAGNCYQKRQDKMAQAPHLSGTNDAVSLNLKSSVKITQYFSFNTPRSIPDLWVGKFFKFMFG